MWWADAARKWIVCILAVAPVGFALPAQWAAHATSRGMGRALLAAATIAPLQGRSAATRRAPGFSITARVTITSGGRTTTQHPGCAATVAVAVTVVYDGHKEWSRGDVLVYQPPRGVRVLNAAAPAALYRAPSSPRRRPARPTLARGGPSPARFALARARHGRTTVNLRLALRAEPLQVRDRRGHRQRVMGAVIGGATRVMRGRTTLSSATLHLFTPIACVTVGSRGQRSKRAPTSPSSPATATVTATATATATPLSSPAAATATSMPPAPHPTAPSPTAAGVPSPTGAPVGATGVPSRTSTPVVAVVTILNYAFNPASITVAPGTTVVWTNRDNVAHTVTADDGSWGSGTLAQGGMFSHTFTTAGTYAYHCAIHPGMTGSVIVTASAEARLFPSGPLARSRRPSA